MSQFTPDEYLELLALKQLEPVGVDRFFHYLALICIGMSGGRVGYNDLMFMRMTNQDLLAQYLVENSDIIEMET